MFVDLEPPDSAGAADSAKPIFLYDGDCGICERFVELAQRIDRRQAFEFFVFQTFPEAERRRYGLSDEAFQQGIYLIDPRTGKAYQGIFAINRLFYRYWPYRLLVILVHCIPLFLLVELIVYSFVARNRARISGWFGWKQCRIRK
jgi:predicted DCC family thiol-disulfide oxidoreductase YuxK